VGLWAVGCIPPDEWRRLIFGYEGPGYGHCLHIHMPFEKLPVTCCADGPTGGWPPKPRLHSANPFAAHLPTPISMRLAVSAPRTP
jgi:hypothetical protein